MCTVTWLRNDEGYQLFCNRDEKLTRGRAMAPRHGVRDGVRLLAPRDADFGGTWIATNEYGVSLCLLNGVNLANPCGHPRARSRGLLLLDLISSASLAEVCERVRYTDLAAFAPFTLAGLEPGAPAAVIEWNGSRRTVGFQDELWGMLTSSSFDTEKVRKRRREEFMRLIFSGQDIDANALASFHQSHSPTRSAYSVCMHRLDAETLSFSRIAVSRAEIDFFYTPAAPCEQAPGVRLKLTRRTLNGSSSAPNPTLLIRAPGHPAAS